MYFPHIYVRANYIVRQGQLPEYMCSVTDYLFSSSNKKWHVKNSPPPIQYLIY